MKEFTGVSEQGKHGLLWTIFEGAPFKGRRIASFSDWKEALDYKEWRTKTAASRRNGAKRRGKK